jgi:hypothetical protein
MRSNGTVIPYLLVSGILNSSCIFYNDINVYKKYFA